MCGVLRTQGKSQLAYEQLKHRILVSELAPGQPLHEAELIGRLGCGRTPIREAIQRLAAEKLVVAHLHQTPFVAPILAHELAEIVETRLVLEVPAARLAAARGTVQERAALMAASDAFRADARADNRGGILAADAAIHGLIACMSRNSFLADCADRLAVFSQRVWSLSVRNAGGDEAFIACHDDLTRTICAGHPAAAARAAADHVAMFRQRLGHLIQPIAGPSNPEPASSAAA